MEQYQRDYMSKLDGEYGLSVVKKLVEFKSFEKGFRNAGSEAETQAANWIGTEMNRIGLKNVAVEEFPVDGWTFLGGSGCITSGTDIYPFDVCSFPGAPATDDKGIEGEVVYIGEGTKRDYEGKDVKGKIVLIETRIFTGNWYNSIFKQAELLGVKAVLAAPTPPNPGSYSDDLITVQELETKIVTPVFSISMKTGKELKRRLKTKEHVTVSIKAKAILDREAKGHFVSGMIPGENPEKNVMICGHYDAYWEGVMDNASSLGSILCIAKAMIESGYKPANNIIFTINGAEEFGHADTLYAWMAGSQALVNAHPEWMKKTVLFFNIETSALCQDTRLGFSISPVYRNIANEFCREIKELTNNYYEGHYLADVGMGADDYIVSCAGTPAMLHKAVDVYSDFSDDGFMAYYHTTEDNLGKFSQEYFEINNAIYGLALMKYMSYQIPPMDFNMEFDRFLEEIPLEILGECGELTEYFINTLNDAKIAADRLNAAVNKTMNCNGLSVETENAVTEKVLDAYRILRNELYKIDIFLSEELPHKILTRRVDAFQKLYTGIVNGNKEQAIGEFLQEGHNHMITDFDYEVYYAVAIEPFMDETYKYWAEGKVYENRDCYKVVNALIDETDITICKAELETIREYLAADKKLLQESLKGEIKLLESIMKQLAEATEIIEENIA